MTPRAPRLWSRRIADERQSILQNAGALWTTRTRATDSFVTLYRAKDAGLDADTPYVLVCEAHGTLLEVSSEIRGRAFSPCVKDWCERCREAPPVTKVKDNHGRRRS